MPPIQLNHLPHYCYYCHHKELPTYHAKRAVVILMGVSRVAQIAQHLSHDCKYPVETPVAIVERATTPQQRVIFGALHNIGDLAAQQRAKAPATIIVGDVVSVLNNDMIL